MSGIINKVKDALSHDNTATTHSSTTHTTGTGHNTSTNHGTHDSNLANKADPRFDSDRDHRADGPGLTGTHNTHGTHTGTGAASHNTTGYGASNSTAGPHSSNIANQADPRVDSDLSKSHHNTTGTAHGSSNTTAGPHSSNLANKIDPRVDSDLDGSRNAGAAHNTHSSTGVGSHSHTTGSTNHGTHNSNLANKADPRIDSDRDHRADGPGLTGTHNTHGTHTGTGVGSHSHTTGSTNHGQHNSNLANKADPRIDSDRDHRADGPGLTGSHNTHNTHNTHTTGATHGATGNSSHTTPGSGTAQHTAGPHNSDLLNKLDPRVDSDQDGSKTFGGNKTHA